MCGVQDRRHAHLRDTRSVDDLCADLAIADIRFSADIAPPVGRAADSARSSFRDVVADACRDRAG